MSIADEVKTLMAADTSLQALLTGGVWAGISEISRQDAPSAFDANKELKPCALVKVGPEIPRGPYKRSTQEVIMIYFYQRKGTGRATIDSAMDRTYILLHDKKIGTKTFAILHDQTLYSYEVVQREENALSGAAMGMQRYLRMRTRQ